MRPKINTPEKNSPAGMRPRDGRENSQMAGFMSRVLAFFKAELAITNTTGDDERDDHLHRSGV